MAKAQQAEENYWPGFVDALSTIVMVVTFLLIILAIAIFVMSLNVAKVALDKSETAAATQFPEQRDISVDDAPMELAAEGATQTVLRSENVLRLRFAETTAEIDPRSRAEIDAFLDKHAAVLADVEIEISAYFDPDAPAASKQRRIAFYRLMAMRSVLMQRGYPAESVSVFVREAPDPGRVGAVEVYAR